MADRNRIKTDQRILVVDLAFIGDLLMSTPALACLRKSFPEARIDIMVSSVSRPVIEHNPDVDRIIDARIKRKGLKAQREEARRISEEKYDLAICFHRAEGTLNTLMMAGIPERVGFTNGIRRWMVTSGTRFEIIRHRAWNHLRLLEAVRGVEVDYSTPMRLDIDSEVLRRSREELAGYGKRDRLAIINPNASWPTKRWEPEKFARVADYLNESGYFPVIVGSEKERNITGSVIAGMKTDCADFTGRTDLEELAALISLSDLMVTNDSGPMHMAVALGVPATCIFGPTDPSRCGPWYSESRVIQVQLDCIRCYRKRCWHLTCMKEISPSDVIGSMEQVQL